MGIFNIDLRPFAPFLILAACGAGLWFLWRRFKADAAANAANVDMFGLPGASVAATPGQSANTSMAAALFGTASPAGGTSAANNGYPISHYVLPGTSGMFGGGQLEGF